MADNMKKIGKGDRILASLQKHEVNILLASIRLLDRVRQEPFGRQDRVGQRLRRTSNKARRTAGSKVDNENCKAEVSRARSRRQ